MAQLSAKRNLDPWFLPQGEVRECGWLLSFPSYVGHHQRDPVLSHPTQDTGVCCKWEAAGKTAARALGALQEGHEDPTKGHGSYKLCCRLHHESRDIHRQILPTGLKAHPILRKLTHTYPSMASFLCMSPMAAGINLCRQLGNAYRKLSQLFRIGRKHTNLSIHTVLGKVNGKLSASGFAGLREGTIS